MHEFKAAIIADWQITLPFLVVYLATTFVDIGFGLIAAFLKKKLSSTISRAGMMRKVMMLGVVLLAAIFDGMLPAIDVELMGLAIHVSFAGVACLWFTIHELLSIIEHLAILGVPIPKRVADALAIMRDTLDHDKADSDPKPDQDKPGGDQV